MIPKTDKYIYQDDEDEVNERRTNVMNPQWGVHVMMYDDSLIQVYLMQIQGGEKKEEKEGRKKKERRKEGRKEGR